MSGHAPASRPSDKTGTQKRYPLPAAGAKAQSGQPFNALTLQSLKDKGQAIAATPVPQRQGQAIAASSMPVCPPGTAGPPSPEPLKEPHKRLHDVLQAAAEDAGQAAPKPPRGNPKEYGSLDESPPLSDLVPRAHQGSGALPEAPKPRPVIRSGEAGGAGALELPDKLVMEMMTTTPAPIVGHPPSHPPTPTPSEAGSRKPRSSKPKPSLPPRPDSDGLFQVGQLNRPKVELGQASLTEEGFYLQPNGGFFGCAHCHCKIDRGTSGAWSRRELRSGMSFKFRCSDRMAASNWMIHIASSNCDPDTYKTLQGQPWNDRLDFRKASKNLANPDVQAQLTARWGLKVEEHNTLDHAGRTLWLDGKNVREHPDLKDREFQVQGVLRQKPAVDTVQGVEQFPLTIYLTETRGLVSSTAPGAKSRCR